MWTENSKATKNSSRWLVGQGVAPDFVQAHMWCNLAASRLPSGDERDETVKNRDIVEKHMTPAQVAEAQKLAREWRPKAQADN